MFEILYTISLVLTILTLVAALCSMCGHNGFATAMCIICLSIFLGLTIISGNKLKDNTADIYDNENMRVLNQIDSLTDYLKIQDQILYKRTDK